MTESKYMTGGGTSCAINGCTNNRRKINQWKKSTCADHQPLTHEECPCLVPFRFFSMPSKNEQLKLEWTKAINRKALPKKVYVCSYHFIDGVPTSENPTPKLKLGYEAKATPGRRALKRHVSCSTVLTSGKRSRRCLVFEDECDSLLVEETDQDNVCSSQTDEVDADLCASVFPTHSSISTQYIVLDNDHAYSKEWSDNQTASTQTYVISKVDKSVLCVEKPINNLMRADTCLITDSDSLLYTGVKREIFFTLVSCMTPFNTFKFELDIADQLLLVLMRLKLNLIFDDLCRRFGISKSLASKIFSSWIPVLADQLKSLIIWLPREVIRDCCPASFKENFPKTTVIIDCAETFIQRPTCLKSRSETFSNYKSHNTAKYLVGISPHGQNMFISKAFGGRASDKFIVEKNGFLNYLVPGDEVMADRGFTIEELLFPRRVKLNIPDFTRNKPQLSAEEVTSTRRIATVRIHVERAIRRLKVFKALSCTVPVSGIKLFDDILILYAALVNMRDDLIRDTDTD